MILTDHMGHLVSDESLDELHKFASGIGLKREWLQVSGNGICHYDLTTKRKRKQAIQAGATLVDPREIVKKGLRRKPDLFPNELKLTELEWLMIPGNYCKQMTNTLSPNCGRWLAGNKDVILSHGFRDTPRAAIKDAMEGE